MYSLTKRQCIKDRIRIKSTEIINKQYPGLNKVNPKDFITTQQSIK